jgi:hypothetical protein
MEVQDMLKAEFDKLAQDRIKNAKDKAVLQEMELKLREKIKDGLKGLA